jgi:hypothetical protein
VFALPSGLADGGQRVCTQIGCSSGISVELPASSALPRHAVRATVCMNERCRSFSLSERGTSRQVVRIEDRRLAGPGPIRVRVVLRDRRDRRVLRRERVVTLSRAQPNGPDCPPTCWLASLRLGADGRLR